MLQFINRLPIWARIVGAFILVMVLVNGGMIFWGLRQQRQMALQQAKAFAAASSEIVYTALGLAMASGNSQEIKSVLGALEKAKGIKALRVVPTEAVKQQFKMQSMVPADPVEQRAMQENKAHQGLEERGAALVYRAVVPITATRNFIGRDCTSCHQVADGTVLGTVSIELGLEQLQKASADFRLFMVVISLGFGVFFVVGFYFLCRRIIARPLDAVVCQLKDMSQGEGDLTRRLAVRNQDEIGELAQWFNEFVEKIHSTVRRIGDSVHSLASSAEELTAVSHQMGGNAEETSSQANVVSAASEQVSKNVQTVAAGAEEMSASIREIAKNTSEAARVAKEAVTVAEQTNQTINKLGASSAEIGNVVKVITSIAEQTNLLALNATIEAARAGEAGKGFAVVANEVKELAKQTGQATEDISQKISAIQEETQGAVAAIQQIGAIINQINDIANTIASAVEEQTVTTNEMSRNVEEAAKGSNEIVQNITGVAHTAQSTASGATQTQAAALELARLASELQMVVGQFRYDGHPVQDNCHEQPSRSPRQPNTPPQGQPVETSLHAL